MIKLKSLIGLTLNASLKRGGLKSYLLPLPVKRFLYTPSSLGMETFLQAKENEMRVTVDPDAFRNKLRKDCNNENCLIFSSDLKKMYKLAENDDDVDLLIKVIKRVCHQDSVLLSPFKFGPDIMRCLYHLNKPDAGMSLIKDSETLPLFSQIMSFLLLMNMLYTNSMYHSVVEVYEFVKSQCFFKKFPVSLLNLLFASLCKLNTPASFEQGVGYWEEILTMDLRPPIRSIQFFAMLALRQNHFHTAIELLSNSKQTPVGFNIQVLAYAHTKCYDRVFLLFQNHFFNDTPMSETKGFITADTLNTLEILLEKSNDEEICKKLKKLKDEMIAHNFYTEKDLDVFLFQKINYMTHSSNQEKTNPSKREFVRRVNQ